MPCRDWDEGSHTVYVDRAETVAKLCEACRLLEKNGLSHLMSKSLTMWWLAHKKEDEARMQAEKAKLNLKKKREHILSKLTQEEKKILGL